MSCFVVSEVQPESPALPHVVIIGGGFGGLYAARALVEAPVRVTLVDRRNHHVFQPLLYQVATAALNPSDIAAPIRAVLRRQSNARVLLAEVAGIDLTGKLIRLSDGELLPFDYVIVATGATHSYFGHEDWAPYAPGLKTLEDAIEIRRRVLLAYEAAERSTDPDERRALLTFVIVGGGPTGVELAGALAEIARHALASDFRTIDPTQARVLLVEGQPRVLPPYPETLSASAARQLVKLGVEVRTGARVEAVDRGGVVIEGERIASRTVIWAAGVAASPLARSLGVPLDRAGRVVVDDHLRPPGFDNVWVVGDLAAAADQGRSVPGVAGAAIQGGEYAARAIADRARGISDRGPFHYVDKGSMATIGRASAVADFGRVRLSGFFAWLAWGLVHIMFLIGFRNRVLVMLQWLWQYLTFQRGARLITGGGLPTVARAKLEPQPRAQGAGRMPTAPMP
ncbi:MAG TPA: NAD(P)/FAD-dependent oxidoreductase [Polyangia bacterium]|nr:NAD(P)/FAD-dependent oxidoreductase [Polyangia bacterium]